MIAITKQTTDAREKFLEMLPLIQRQASLAFRGLRKVEREDLIAEVVANAYAAFHRLIERGRVDVAYPSPLASFAIRQVRDGRRVGSRLNIRDVSSRHCQQRKGVKVQPLCQWNDQKQRWQEMLVEDRKSTPADIAAIRIDFADWLKSLSPRQRKIAKTLAAGESTGTVARTFRVSAARISQIRRELHDAWFAFQGELTVA